MNGLDLFCGQGGATKGYRDAGVAHMVGVDLHPQPRYCGDAFVQDDALDLLRRSAGFIRRSFGFIHASPPCQAHSDLQRQSKRVYPELIEPTRELLEQIGLPYVIENVPEAPLRDPVILCGTMFLDLRVIRHRGFETNWPLKQPEHPRRPNGTLWHPRVFTHDKRKAHYGQLDQDVSFVQVTGGGNATVANKLRAMGVDWMDGKGVNEAIPPVYAEYVGSGLLGHLSERAPA